MRLSVPKHAAPLALGAALAVGLAGRLAVGSILNDPGTIFWGASLPLALSALVALLLLLPANGRLALMATLVTLSVLEASVGAFDAWQQPNIESHVAQDYYQPHPDLGYGPKPGADALASSTVDGRSIYAVRYTIDDRGRRVVPIGSRGARDRFLLFFGGSFVFGEGVEDDETLPQQVARLAPEYMPYNYAFHGYGPNQLLARLETGTLRGEVAEEEGILVYGMISAHVQRAVGSMRVYTGWADTAPCYNRIDGELRRLGTFTEARPWTSVAYALLGRSRILEHLRIDLPVLDQEHFDLVANMFVRSAALFREQFGPEQRFVVFVYPEHGSSDVPQRLGDALADAPIEFLDYSEILGQDRESFYLPTDLHPTALAHRSVAKQLVRDLDLEMRRAQHGGQAASDSWLDEPVGSQPTGEISQEASSLLRTAAPPRRFRATDPADLWELEPSSPR